MSTQMKTLPRGVHVGVVPSDEPPDAQLSPPIGAMAGLLPFRSIKPRRYVRLKARG